MRTFYSSILFFLITYSVTFGQSHEIKVRDYTITPTVDSTFSHNVYIPENLEDSFREMDKMYYPVKGSPFDLSDYTEKAGYNQRDVMNALDEIDEELPESNPCHS